MLPPPGPLPRYFQRHKAIVTRPRVKVIERAATASLASDLDCKWELPTTGALERPTSLNTESLTVQVILLPHRSTGQTFPDPILPLSYLNASANSPGWRHIEDLDVFSSPGKLRPDDFSLFREVGRDQFQLSPEPRKWPLIELPWLVHASGVLCVKV